MHRIFSKDKEELSMIATTSPVLQILNEKIDVLSLSPEERKLYESRMKLKSDIATISESRFNDGWQSGRLEGKYEGKLEAARNLLTMGLSLEDIIKATDLTVQEVKAL